MAYSIEELGRPVSLVVGTPSCTINEILEWEPEYSREIHSKVPGNTTFPRHCLGNKTHSITIKTADVSKYATLPQGLVVSSVVFLAEAPVVGDDSAAIGLQHDKEFTVTISNGIVETSKISPATDGNTATWELKISACLTDAGAEPTSTQAMSAS